MAITFMGFNLPETVKSMANGEINHFFIEQLKSLGIYVTTFILVAFYWINHIQQFTTREPKIHLAIHALYGVSTGNSFLERSGLQDFQ